MEKIFISYRRADSIGTAGRIRDRLVREFGRDRVFVDVDDIPFGDDFEEVLSRRIMDCRVFLAIIGPGWLDARADDGHRRLGDDTDFVSLAISTALRRTDILLIPVVIDGAKMPHTEDLPETLKPIARRNALELRNTQFGSDAERLIAAIRLAMPGRPQFLPRLAVLTFLACVIAAGVVVNGPLVLQWSGKVWHPQLQKFAAPPEFPPSGITLHTKPPEPSVIDAIGKLREILAPAEGQVEVTIRDGNQIKIGDRIIIDVKSKVSGRLILVDINATGEVIQIFPNSFLANPEAARVAAGVAVSVPSPGYGFSGFQAIAPIGSGQLVALVAPSEVPEFALAQLDEQTSKGFKPVNAPGNYMQQLLDAARGSSSKTQAGNTATARWGFAIISYEIVN